jgi:hypothetical protein
MPPDQESNSDISLYLIFWPEDTTWDDDAPLSVVKNRVTFMRFVSCRIDMTHVSEELLLSFQLSDKALRPSSLHDLRGACQQTSLEDVGRLHFIRRGRKFGQNIQIRGVKDQ